MNIHKALKPNILVVDDTPENLKLLSSMLEEHGFNVRCAINGTLALGTAKTGWSNLILLDITMPEMDGYEVCRNLKSDCNTSDIPIIFLSGLDSIDHKKQAFAAGGVDYICKPFQVDEVLARVRTHLQIRDFQKSLEQKVEERTIQLTQSLKRSEAGSRAKSEFLANMSHELRTPLNAITGYSEILQEEAEDLEVKEFLPDLQKIQSSAKHLLGLISDILDLSKIEADKMELYLEDFEISTLVESITDIIHPSVAKNNNTFIVDYPKNIGSIQADFTKIRQSLLNLLSNAGKFTKEGEIKLKIEHYLKAHNSWISFEVSDSGIGMTPQQIEGLFEAFNQADNSVTREYGGTGLGLTITKKFCEMMGGNLVVTSELGTGSSFIINIPAEIKLTIENQPLEIEPISNESEAKTAEIKHSKSDLFTPSIEQILIESGLITAHQFQLALQEKEHRDLEIAEIFISRGWIEQEIVDFFTKQWFELIEQKQKKSLAHYLQAAKLLNVEQVDTIVRLQQTRSQKVRFHRLAVEQGYIKQLTVDFFLAHLFDIHNSTAISAMKTYEVIKSYDGGNRDFRKIDLSKANLAEIELEKVNFDSSILRKTNLCKANLSHSSLTEVNLQRANLSQAILTEVNFSRSSLIKVNLRSARLEKANFAGADLRNARLPIDCAYEIYYDEHTIFDRNFDPQLRGWKISQNV